MRPIKLTDEHRSLMMEEFADYLKGLKLADGKVSYNRAFAWENSGEKAKIIMTPVAFAKMLMLLQNFSTEVAWHGVAHRDKKKKDTFHITDILVYPQVVTGSTVNTDQDEYTQWLYSQKDEVFNNIRMQGHSHVNFGTTPSTVDLTHQEEILKQLDDDMFYIFMIWNKKMERTAKIYDLKTNTLFEDKDIEVLVGNEGIDMEAFLKDAKDQVKTKTYPTYGGAYGAYQGGKTNAGHKSKPKGGSEIKGNPYLYDWDK